MARESFIHKELDINSIKSEFSEKTNIVDGDLKENFQDNKTKIFSNDLELAKFFLNCYDTICLNVDQCKLEEFKKFFDQFHELNNSFRNNFRDYDNGLGYDDWIIEERIRDLVCSNRKEIIKFLDVFNKVFIEA